MGKSRINNVSRYITKQYHSPKGMMNVSRHKTLEELFGLPVEEVKELPPEEIGSFILQYFDQQEKRDPGEGPPNLHNFMGEVKKSTFRDAEREFAEGLHWLYVEGLVADLPGQPGHFVFITRKGKQLNESSDLSAYLYSSLLPRATLDPTLERKVRPAFIRGDYDVAVLQAYKEVEISVSNASGITKYKSPVDLMRKAFNVPEGPLTDKVQHDAEKEALGHVFAGVIGYFKNPLSHRDIGYGPHEAAELIYFANYLLKFVERRREMKLVTTNEDNQG